VTVPSVAKQLAPPGVAALIGWHIDPERSCTIMTAAGFCEVVELLPPEAPLVPPPLEEPLPFVPELPVAVESLLVPPPGLAPPSGSETGEKQHAPRATLAIAATESLRMTHYRAKIQPRARRGLPNEWPALPDAPWSEQLSRGSAP
jgi:hypothetical protein